MKKRVNLTLHLMFLTSLMSCASQEKIILEEIQGEHSDIVEYLQSLEDRVKALEDKFKNIL